MDLQDFINISSILGTLFGIGGFFFSLAAWWNTKSIVTAVDKEKIRGIYPIKHQEFYSKINSALTSLENGSTNYLIVKDLLKSCVTFQRFYDNCKTKEKSEVKRLLRFLYKFPPDKEFSIKKKNELQNKLYKIHAMMERIGELNGYNSR